jgi:hypothetical protein
LENVWNKLENRAKTPEEKSAVQRAALSIAELHGFINNYIIKTPKQILKLIEKTEEVLKNNFLLSDMLKSKIRSSLYFYEIQTMRTVLLSTGHNNDLQPDVAPFNKATEEDQKKGTILFDKAKKEEFKNTYLEQLRTLCSNSPEFDEAIKKPIGRGLTRNVNSSTPSKDWPIVGNTILILYQLLLPMYKTKHRIGVSRREGIPENQHAQYPQELLQDIVKILRSELPELLDDLTPKDVKSRIKYRLDQSSKDAPLLKVEPLFFHLFS